MNLNDRLATAFPPALLATVAKAATIAVAGSLAYAAGWVILTTGHTSPPVAATTVVLCAVLGYTGTALGYTRIGLYRPILAASFTVTIILIATVVFALVQGLGAIDWTGFPGLAGYAAIVYAMAQGDREPASDQTEPRASVADITGRWADQPTPTPASTPADISRVA